MCGEKLIIELCVDDFNFKDFEFEFFDERTFESELPLKKVWRHLSCLDPHSSKLWKQEVNWMSKVRHRVKRAHWVLVWLQK